MSGINIWVKPKVLDSAIVVNDKCEQLLYVRGFQLTRDRSQSLPEHWNERSFRDYWFAWDSRIDAAFVADDEVSIAILGSVYHLGLRTSDIASIAADLHRARSRGADHFDRQAQMLSGRYVLADGSTGGINLHSDATGMRSVYYCTSGGAAASHARLVASLIGDERRSTFGAAGWFRETGARAIPGRRTEYESVSMLTPNTKVEINTGEVARIASSASGVERPSEEIASEVIPLVHSQFEALVGRGNVLLSLTAGLDSRTTLAMARPVASSLQFFSYVTRRPGKPSPSEPDMLFARGLCEDLGLDFQEVVVDTTLGRGPLMQVMRNNSTRIHVPSIAAAYMRQLPPDSIHVRSNLYEIGRALIRGRSRGRAVAPLDAREVARRIAGNVQHDSFECSVEASAEWLDITGFGSETHYDELDLYYWELLMGKWLPAVMIESDVAHDTYTVINSRHIIDLMLSAPLEERLEGGVAKAIINIGWPRLMDYPINGHKAQ